VEIPAEQVLLAKQVVAENMPVRELEILVERIKKAPRKPRATRDDIPANHVLYISDMLRRHLGTSVRVKTCRTLANGKKTKGRVEIEFYSVDDFNRILDLLGVSERGTP
jgi:ParB family chromosome partitioning protein